MVTSTFGGGRGQCPSSLPHWMRNEAASGNQVTELVEPRWGPKLKVHRYQDMDMANGDKGLRTRAYGGNIVVSRDWKPQARLSAASPPLSKDRL
jgi:hypothetical protein